jgi:hypothetical protein
VSSAAARVLFVVVVAACGSSQESVKTEPPAAPPASPEAAWSDAEQIAAAYVVAREGPMKQPVLARHPTIPYLFEVFMNPRGVLVHRGAVVEARGMAALRRYADDAAMLDAPTPSATDMIGLVHALGLWPPTVAQGGADPAAFAPLDDARTALRPQVSRKGRAVVFQLYYASAPAGTSSTATASAVDEWTLAIEPTGEPLWIRRQRMYDGDRLAD